MPRHSASFVSAAVAVCAAVAITACSPKSSSPTSTLQPAVIDGAWSGAVSDMILGSGTLSMSLTQFGDSVSGTWSSTFPNQNDDLVGTVRGIVGASTLTVLLKPLGGSTCQFGPFELTATVTSAGSMSGTLTEAYPCAAYDSGTFWAQKAVMRAD